MPNLMPAISPARLDAIHNDFIPHPAQFPIHIRRRNLLSWKRRHEPNVPISGDVGLSFHTEKYIAPGTQLELEIPLRGVTQHFDATVVMVREQSEGFEIGLWFATADDAMRARIVEKICHTECYLQTQHHANN